MVSEKMQPARFTARSLDGRTALLTHRLRAVGCYAEADVKWDLTDIPPQHTDAMVISGAIPTTAEQHYAQHANYYCEAQMRMETISTVSHILEVGLAYRVIKTTGKGKSRIFHIEMWLPPSATDETPVQSDEAWTRSVLELHDKLMQLGKLEADDKSGTDEPGDKSDTSETSEKELAERLRKALH